MSVPLSVSGNQGNCTSVCKALNLDDNKHPQILKDIKLIRFPNLRFFRPTGNEISSIEGIYKLDMPSLEEIFLSMFVHIKTII